MLTALLPLPFDALAFYIRNAPPHPHIPWGVIGVVAFVWVLSGASKRDRRSSTGGTAAARKRCGTCQSEHPGFAQYCRQCGRKI